MYEKIVHAAGQRMLGSIVRQRNLSKLYAKVGHKVRVRECLDVRVSFYWGLSRYLPKSVKATSKHFRTMGVREWQRGFCKEFRKALATGKLPADFAW